MGVLKVGRLEGAGAVGRVGHWRTLWLLVPLALFLVVGAMWVPRLLVHPFHEDEAIYAAWSLQILRGDFWLSATAIDKPPLTFYPIAASVALFGRHEWAARLPSLFWTGLMLLSLWRIVERRGRSGWLPVLLALSSPLLWALATSAFTDLAMLALALLALERGMARHPRQAGVAFALAFLAKPTALLLTPLLLLNLPRRLWSRFVLGGAAPLLLAWAWDASRTAPSWWALGRNAYGSLGEMSGQVGAWVGLVLVSMGAMATIGGVFGLVWRQKQLKPMVSAWGVSLLLTVLLWVPVHIVLGFQPWERYLLPMVPLVALLLTEFMPRLDKPQDAEGGVANGGGGFRNPPLQGLAVGIVLFVMTFAIMVAPSLVERARLEPHDGGWQGIGEIGEAIEALPAGATVFYTDMGRPLAWYTADARADVLWGGENTEAVAERLRADPVCPCYLAVRASTPLPDMMKREVVAQSGHFLLLALDK